VTKKNNSLELITIKYLKKQFKKHKLKINSQTILLNEGLELDSIEFLNLVLYVEKKSKKKFSNKAYQNLMDIKVSQFVNFFD
tara:strand:+ start:42 stop:287 length:246 start_codon:yes stop_codon:yes gene_type:complete